MPRRPIRPGAWQKRLVGIAEMAEIFGVHKSSITEWARYGDLPEPWDTLKLGRVWRYEDIAPLIGQLPTPHGRSNREAMQQHWAERRRREAARTQKTRAQNGSPSTGTSSSSETR